MNKLLATALGSALLSGGAVYGVANATYKANLEETQAVFGATLEASTAEIEAQKHAILKDNVWKDVRLGIPPEFNTVVSSQEMTDAYVAVAEEMNAKTDPNLYTALREKAVSLGIECKI